MSLLQLAKQCRRRLCEMQASLSFSLKRQYNAWKRVSISVGGLRQFLGQFSAVSLPGKLLRDFSWRPRAVPFFFFPFICVSLASPEPM